MGEQYKLTMFSTHNITAEKKWKFLLQNNVTLLCLKELKVRFYCTEAFHYFVLFEVGNRQQNYSVESLKIVSFLP